MNKNKKGFQGILYATLLSILVLECLAATTTVRLTIGNSPPVVSSITLSQNPIDLMENTVTTFWCNATLNDSNGWQDIVSASAVLWQHGNSSFGGINDYNKHYTNSSCHLSTGSGTMRDASCLFRIYYFANPGNWTCRITVEDTAVGTNSSRYNETGFFINPLLALTTTPEINFGTMIPGETSNISVIMLVNNTCNQEIDIMLSSPSDISCTQGTIQPSYVRYNLTDMSHDRMCPLTYTTDDTCPEVKNNFNLQKCTTSSGTPSNPGKDVYWRVQAPYGISGSCTSTLIVTAKET